MFYNSHAILARKSPLGTVWIAAHIERKMNKPQIDGINIPSYADQSAEDVNVPLERCQVQILWAKDLEACLLGQVAGLWHSTLKIICLRPSHQMINQES